MLGNEFNELQGMRMTSPAFTLLMIVGTCPISPLLLNWIRAIL